MRNQQVSILEILNFHFKLKPKASYLLRDRPALSLEHDKTLMNTVILIHNGDTKLTSAVLIRMKPFQINY